MKREPTGMRMQYVRSKEDKPLPPLPFPVPASISATSTATLQTTGQRRLDLTSSPPLPPLPVDELLDSGLMSPINSPCQHDWEPESMIDLQFLLREAVQERALAEQQAR